MNISTETLTIFVFLIPGFVSSLILNTVVVRSDKDQFSKIVEALVFSFIIYVIISIVNNDSPIHLKTTKIDKTITYSIAYNYKILIPVFTLSVLFPLVLGFFVVTDIHMIILRKIKITNKTSRDTAWLDVFTEQKRYIIVNLTDGRRIFGWPMYYSNSPEDGLLYLYDAAWINNDGEYVELDIHGLFLVKKDNMESIEFTTIDKVNATTKRKDEI
jgi:hypothetical protein